MRNLIPLKYLIMMVSAMLLMAILSCSSETERDKIGLDVYDEYLRLGLNSFVEAIDYTMPETDGYLIDARSIPGINAETAANMGFCHLYGKLPNPNGIYFNAKGRGFYVAINEEIAPWQIKNYKIGRLRGSLFKVYRAQ